MAHTLYNEVTAVTGIGYTTDRVLGKLTDATLDLPYTLEEIKISHNDFAVTEVYNDSIRKLYRNYLYLIANAEIVTTSSPVSSVGDLRIDKNTYTASLCTANSTAAISTSADTLSGINSSIETHIAKKIDSNNFVYFHYSTGDSVVVESTTEFGSFQTILSGNFVEHYDPTTNTGIQYKFKEVVSVDIVDEFLFVLDKGNLTLFKFDISGLISNDPVVRRKTLKDNNHPGRFLLKTLGGTEYTQVKNRLVDPIAISIYDNRIYVLDNGTRSIKIYDLNFNYIKDVRHGPFIDDVNYPGDRPVSFVIDQFSDTNKTPRGYILTSKGRIFEYLVNTDFISSGISLFESYLPYEIYVFDENRTPATKDQQKLYKPEGSNFKKIVNSKSSKNILYVATNRNIYKLYKTNLTTPITRLDFASSTGTDGHVTFNRPINITTDFRDISSQTIESFDTVLHDDYDYMSVTTNTLSTVLLDNTTLSGYKTSTYFFTDKNITTKLYNDSFYTNYFPLSDIYVLPQEIVNHITFNKTTKKLIYNHYSFFENLHKKIYTYNTKANLGTSIVPAISTVNFHSFPKLSAFDDNNDFYIGVNEPLLTDVINRPIELLYEQQKVLFDFIKEESLNNNPPVSVNTRLPGIGEDITSVVTLSTDSVTVNSGEIAKIGVTRANFASVDTTACSIEYYTLSASTTSTGQALTEHQKVNAERINYIDSKDPSILVFEPGETIKYIEIDTAKFFPRDLNNNIVDKTNVYNLDPSKYNRNFTVSIRADQNCILDEEDANALRSCKVKITPDFEKYNIKLVTPSNFTNRKTGNGTYTAQVSVQRTSSDANYSLSAACMLFTAEQNLLDEMSYSPVVPDRGLNYGVYATDDTGARDVVGDYPVLNVSYNNEVSAKNIDKTSTVFFMPGVSSVVFDVNLTSTYSKSIDRDSSIDINILNPTTNAQIDVGNEHKRIMIDETFKTISLHVSSISAMHRVDSHNATNQTLLSCINIWEALSASNASDHVGSNTFSEVSANYPISACFIIDQATAADSLSVISVKDDLPAIYFKPTNNLQFEFLNNQIDIVVKNSTNSIVGKGGRGGYGLAAEAIDTLYGSAFDGGDDAVYIGSWLTGRATKEDDSQLETHTGAKGGAALSGFDNYFQQKLIITNNGKVFGGAGGGGGGLPGISATKMPPYAWPLWFGCGGGGGGGIHSENVGIGGSAAVNTFNFKVSAAATKAYLQDGTDGGSEGKGGAGGTWDTSHKFYPTIELQPAVAATEETEAIAAVSATVTNYRAVTGNPGGNIGEPGKGDGTANYYTINSSLAKPVLGDDGTWDLILDNYRLREGGAAGDIITSTLTVITTAGTGTFHGTGNY